MQYIINFRSTQTFSIGSARHNQAAEPMEKQMTTQHERSRARRADFVSQQLRARADAMQRRMNELGLVLWTRHLTAEEVVEAETILRQIKSIDAYLGLHEWLFSGDPAPNPRVVKGSERH